MLSASASTSAARSSWDSAKAAVEERSAACSPRALESAACASRKALSAWLGAPPSLVMQPVFKDHTLEGEEVLALVAYLKSVAENPDAEASASILQFLLLGFGGTLFLLVLFDFLWRKRYRASRRPMLRNSRRPAMGSHS